MTSEKVETARAAFRTAEDRYYDEVRRAEWSKYPTPLSRTEKDRLWDEIGLPAWRVVIEVENNYYTARVRYASVT